MNYEQVFLGSAMLEPTLIDHAIGSGLKADAFTSDDRKRIWLQLLDSRTNSKLTDMQSILLEMGTDCPSDELLACESSAPTQIAAYIGALTPAWSIYFNAEGYNIYISTTEIGRVDVVHYNTDTISRSQRIFEHLLALWRWRYFDPRQV